MSSLVHIRRQDLSLVRKIGEGGFGSVYHTVWKSESGDVHVAAKRLYKVESPELHILSKLNHPNIVKLIGVVPEELDFMLVLELCEGGSLRSYLDANNRLPLSADLFERWSRQAAVAIQYLHQMHIVHKDIKCANYLISGSDVLKLADFGLAKEIEKAVSSDTHRGSWTHMAPELLQNCELSPKFDIFAYGVALWEMLTGQVPYEGMGYQAIVWHVCHENKRLEIPSECPPHLAELMTLCWQEDRIKRPSIDQVLLLLQKPYTTQQQQRLCWSMNQKTASTTDAINNLAFSSFLDTPESQVGVWELETKFGHQDGPQSHHLQELGGIAVLKNDSIVVSDICTGQVMVCDNKGRPSLRLTLDNKVPRAPEFMHYSPQDVVVGSDGNYFMTDLSCYVKIYDSNGKCKDEFLVCLHQNQPGKSGTRLVGLAIDNNGYLLVGASIYSSPKTGFISKHSQSGRHVSSIPLTILPQFLAVTPLDTIVVSSWSPPWTPKTVQIVHESGQLLRTLQPSDTDVAFWRPTGVCCSTDTIFVSNDNQVAPYEFGIYCFSLSGDYLGCATKDVKNPTGVTVTDDGKKLLVTQYELGNHLAGCGLHGVKVFLRK